MSMKIRNNRAAMESLGAMNKNRSELDRSLLRVARGERITGAANDASGYAISERMRALIRVLDQDTRNVQTGASLLRVAEGGVQSIVDELRTLKEFAINAANDHNTDADRATIQKEFDRRRDNINEIASTTNYNGKLLLDGTFARKSLRENAAKTAQTTDGTAAAASAGSQNATAAATITTVTEITTTVQTSGDAVAISTTGDHTISEDGVYDLAGYSGTLTITAENVKLINSANNVLNEVMIVDGGLKNLWLDNINIKNESYASDKAVIAFSGADNCLHLIGNNSLYTIGNYENAVVYAADGLTIVGDSLSVTNANNHAGGAGIGAGGSGGNRDGYYIDGFSRSCGDISIGNGTTITIINNGLGPAGLGSGRGSKCGNISIGQNASVSVNLTYAGTPWGAAIGTGGNTGYYENKPGCGDIFIGNGATVTANVVPYVERGTSYGAAIGTGNWMKCGNIYIGNATITGTSKRGAVIGSGDMGTCSDIIISSGATINANKLPDPTLSNEVVGETIGSGFRGYSGDIIIDDPYDLALDITSSAVEPTGGKKTVTTERTQKVETTDDITGLTAGTVSETNTETSTETDGDTTTTTTITTTTTVTTVINDQSESDASRNGGTGASAKKDGDRTRENPLVIHTGPRANQALNVYINDMHTKSMIADTTSGNNAKELARLSGVRADELQSLFDEAQGKSLDDANVTTRRDANVAIIILEGAIEYALDEATNLGAYLSRLEYTAANLVTVSENTQASESTLRDADMAAEMTTYTKNNLLTQTAQAMLAQANRDSSGILSLLQ